MLLEISPTLCDDSFIAILKSKVLLAATKTMRYIVIAAEMLFQICVNLNVRTID